MGGGQDDALSTPARAPYLVTPGSGEQKVGEKGGGNGEERRTSATESKSGNRIQSFLSWPTCVGGAWPEGPRGVEAAEPGHAC